MSLITQCPACATMFRVVPDQLRISEGWVRCGHCDEVFDANAQLRNLDEPALEGGSVVPPVNGTASNPNPELEEELTESNVAYDWGPMVPPAPVQPEPERATRSESVLAQAVSQAEDDVLDPGDVLPQPTDAHSYGGPIEPYLEPGFQASSVSDDPLMPEAAPRVDEERAFHIPEDVANLDSVMDSAPTVAEEVPLSFMPRPEPISWWGRLFGTKVVVASCILLLLLLVTQYFVFQRDRIAALVPTMRPALHAVCDFLACKISPPKQIESIAIDSSAFTSVKPGIYLLNVTLKNGATLDVATPALELTLTDMQDRSLLRWVVQPNEFNDKQGVIAAGAEVVVNLPIAVRSGATIDKIAGYKLLAFYP